MPEPNYVGGEPARKELEAVIASGIFDRSPNLGILLQYVCRKALEGKADEIKEYNIAVEAFGRGPDFDKRRDSIVRVEAHRLRKRLIQYYSLEEGANHEVRIEIPAGRYVPSFLRQAETAPETEGLVEQTVPEPPVVVKRRVVRVAIGILATAATAAAVYFPFRFETVWRPHRTVEARAAGIETVASVSAGTDTVRIMAGSTAPTYTDPSGAVWAQDQYFTGGSVGSTHFRSLGRTRDPTLYLKRREGDFRYDVPLKPGGYEMRLHFAETTYGEGNIEGGGETSRLFAVYVNERPLLDFFDVISDAEGPNTADIKVFKDIVPAADGYLHLRFVSEKAFAFVNGIEIVPGERGHLRPMRFVLRATGYTDNQNRLWLPDSYWSGGRTVMRQEEVKGAADPGIYQSERYGNFTYAIPVAPGSYTVVLHFAEGWHGPNRPEGGGAGSRLFDVFCNRALLLKDFDIFAEAKGDYRALAKTFTGLKPNAQGKLLLSFVPTRNYACVNAIEVLDEGR